MYAGAVSNLRVGGASPSAPSSAVAALFLSAYDHDASRVSIPRPEAHLVVRFGTSATNGLDVHAVGARQTVHRKWIRSGQWTVTARLRLGTTGAVLGAPAHALAGRVVALEDLWGGPAARRLRDRLGGARDADAAAAVLAGAIEGRVTGSNGRDAGARLALDAALRLTGANVNAVALDLGVSERHLRRVFRETVGVSPKAFAKIARFGRAIRAAHEGGGWASVATAAGYYDQAHLIAEFRAIAGVTPRAFLGELRAVPPL